MTSRPIASSPVATDSVWQDQVLLDVEEVAHILRVPRSWVYSHLSELPAIRLGRYVRFKRSEIERFLEQKTGAC